MELLKAYGYLPIRVEKDEDGIYTVSCAALGFSTYGRTVEEGMGNFEEVVEMCVAVQSCSSKRRALRSKAYCATL